jgi:hypothetical protein
VIPVANLPPVLLIPVVHLDLQISLGIFEKIWNDTRGVILGGLGEDDSWKNLKQKISWPCPFKHQDTKDPATQHLTGIFGYKPSAIDNNGQSLNMMITSQSVAGPVEYITGVPRAVTSHRIGPLPNWNQGCRIPSGSSRLAWLSTLIYMNTETLFSCLQRWMFTCIAQQGP